VYILADGVSSTNHFEIPIALEVRTTVCFYFISVSMEEEKFIV